MQSTPKTRRRIYARQKGFKTILSILFFAILIFLVVLIAMWGYQEFFRRNTYSILNPHIYSGTIDEIKKRVKEKGYTVELAKGYVSNSIISIKLKDGPEVLFTAENDLNLAINAMDGIIKKMTIDNKKPKKIDLRFDKPIVKL